MIVDRSIFYHSWRFGSVDTFGLDVLGVESVPLEEKDETGWPNFVLLRSDAGLQAFGERRQAAGEEGCGFYKAASGIHGLR